MTGIVLAILEAVVCVAFLIALACSALGAAHWWLDRRAKGADVGLHLLAEDHTPDPCEHDITTSALGDGKWLHECRHCPVRWVTDMDDTQEMEPVEDFALPSIEEDPLAIRLGLVDDPGDVKLTALGYARYADRTVHRSCLAARRDGQEPCYWCAPVLAGAS